MTQRPARADILCTECGHAQDNVDMRTTHVRGVLAALYWNAHFSSEHPDIYKGRTDISRYIVMHPRSCGAPAPYDILGNPSSCNGEHPDPHVCTLPSGHDGDCHCDECGYALVTGEPLP